jgi:uncharacterized protein DUF4258
VAPLALDRMRERVRTRAYVMTLHAEDEMDSDGLTIFDVESVILTGKIIERQRDRKTGERKYLIRGETIEGGRTAVVVGKFGPTDKLVILTVYTE